MGQIQLSTPEVIVPSTPPQHAYELLRSMLNADAGFRAGQWEAIETVAIHKKRALVVQRTGADLLILRGTLTRESLRLQNIILANQQVCFRQHP